MNNDQLAKMKRIDEDSNAFTVSFDEKILASVRKAYEDSVKPMANEPSNAKLFAGGQSIKGGYAFGDNSFFITSYGEAPLLWFSTNDLPTYNKFTRYYQDLEVNDDIRKLIDVDKGVVVYCGFYVIGKQLPAELWHVDYFPGANGYTLLTPLYDLEPGQGNLLYLDKAGQPQEYPYKMGEAIIVGDNFTHTTQPYESTGKVRVLLSLAFGTDKLQYWDILEKTVGHQSDFLMLPCGHQRGSCQCIESRNGTV